MWLTSGMASGHKTLLQYSSTNTPQGGECYEEEVQPNRKTDYKPMIYIIWNSHMFFHIYTHTFKYVSSVFIELLVYLLNYMVKKGYKIAQYFLLCSCLTILRTIIVVTFDIVA